MCGCGSANSRRATVSRIGVKGVRWSGSKTGKKKVFLICFPFLLLACPLWSTIGPQMCFFWLSPAQELAYPRQSRNIGVWTCMRRGLYFQIGPSAFGLSLVGVSERGRSIKVPRDHHHITPYRSVLGAHGSTAAQHSLLACVGKTRQ